MKSFRQGRLLICDECREMFKSFKRKKRVNLCPGCALKKVDESIKQMREQKGVFYNRWKNNLKRSL